MSCYNQSMFRDTHLAKKSSPTDTGWAARSETIQGLISVLPQSDCRLSISFPDQELVNGQQLDGDQLHDVDEGQRMGQTRLS